MMKTNPHINILAVDDNPSNLVALEAVFQGTQYKIITAGSGEEALTILKSDIDIVLVLLDVQMPVMDGFETAQKIKLTEGCSDLPIIFITAVYNEDPFVKKGYASGAIDYFSKPFDPEILKMKVDMYSSFKLRSKLLKEREKRIFDTEELLKAGRKLSEVLEGLTVGVLIADIDGNISQTNEAVSKVLKTDEAVKKDLYGEILTWWSDNGNLLKDEGGTLWKALHQGVSSHNVIHKMVGIDGSELRILLSASPLKSKDGTIVGAVLVVQDVTESKRIEKDFEERLSKLISLGIELEHLGPH